MPRAIIGQELYEALTKAGIADELTRRVIIDIPSTDIPTIYIEKLVDERVNEIFAPLAEGGYRIAGTEQVDKDI